MTKKEQQIMEEKLLNMNPEERKKLMDSIYYQSKGMTGYASIDEPWMKHYGPNAREIANNIPEGKSVSDVVIEKLDENTDVPALQYFNTTISRPELKELIEKWAKAFREIGVEADEVVPIYGTFFPDVHAILLALNQIGAISYPLKLAETKEDFERETADSKVAIVFDGLWNNVKNIFSDDRFKYVISISAADRIKPPLHQIVKFKSYLDAKKSNSLIPSSEKYLHTKDMMERAEVYKGEYKEPFKKNRTAFINTSSGSTIDGRVKGIMSSNEAAICQLAKSEASGIPYAKGDRVLTSLPPTVSTAMVCLFMYPLYKGLTIIDEPRVGENKFYSQVMSYKPQITFATGSFWKKFFRELQEEGRKKGLPDLSFLKMPIIGGENMTPRELEALNETLKLCGSPATLFDGYGMSELFSVFSSQKESTKSLEDKSKPVMCAGLPFPNIQAGIFDEEGNELMYNQRGELYMKDKDIVMQGYYKKPELTREVLKDGWLHSGDIAEIDEEGLVYIYGRKKDKTILPSGKEVYLFDIANKIKENKNIQDVMIFSIPLADGSNSLLAHVIFASNFYGDKKSELELIDRYLDVVYNGEVKIDGYKEHDKAFTISPTTTKADRNSMYKDRVDYTKIIDGNEYKIDLIETTEGLMKEIKNQEKSKILKKQI